MWLLGDLALLAADSAALIGFVLWLRRFAGGQTERRAAADPSSRVSSPGGGPNSPGRKRAAAVSLYESLLTRARQAAPAGGAAR
jgi:hypothetical protein